MSPEAPHRNHAGRWILVDSIENKLKVLSIGDDVYPGISAQSVVDQVARTVLLPRMRKAATTGREVKLPASYGTQDLVTWVKPVTGQRSKKVLGVLGCYSSAELPMPEPPLVGSLEWLGAPPGGRIRAYWNADVYRIYGLPLPDLSDPALQDDTAWEAPAFVDRLVDEAWRPEMGRIIQGFFNATEPELRLGYYKIVNQKTGLPQSMRLAARRDFTDLLCTRGMSTQITDTALSAATSPAWDVMAKTFELLKRDHLCLIDTTYEFVYSSSPSLRALGIDLEDLQLETICHHDDFLRLRAFLRQTEQPGADSPNPIQVRWRLKPEGWITLELVAVGLGEATDHPHHIMCRVTPN